MVKRILIGVAVVLIGYFGYLAYQRYRATQRLNSGDVSGSDGRGGSVTDPEGEEVKPTPSRSDTPATPTRPHSAAVAAFPTALSSSAGVGEASVAPATDSIAPNPQNGMAFAGTGRFQVYRQGNLTWRVNTDNGSSCILFATNEEWRKPIVYSHGCGNS